MNERFFGVTRSRIIGVSIIYELYSSKTEAIQYNTTALEQQKSRSIGYTTIR